jgi:hypothetical protein
LNDEHSFQGVSIRRPCPGATQTRRAFRRFLRRLISNAPPARGRKDVADDKFLRQDAFEMVGPSALRRGGNKKAKGQKSDARQS